MGSQGQVPLNRANLAKIDSKKSRGKQIPTGEKKPAQPKSPAPKRAKEITYAKLFIVQQQYRPNEMKLAEEKLADEEEQREAPKVEIEADEEEKPAVEEEAEKPAAEGEAEAEAEQPKEDEAIENEEEQHDQEPDERGEEAHEEYQESVNDGNDDSEELYDPNDTREIQVNSKNKVTSLKKIILESIGLSTRKALIVLLK